MHNDIEKILFNAEELSAKAKSLGAEISRDYQGKVPLMICILRGAVLFFADLCRNIDIPIRIDFVNLSSYGSETVSSGEVKIRQNLIHNPQGEDIIIVEDIIDTGLTMKMYKARLLDRHAASVKVCTLLKKPDQKCEIDIDYKGFDIEDKFVVGYGLDYDEKYRNLPYIGILKKEIYSK